MSVKGTNNLCKFWIEEIVKWEKYEIYSNKLNLKIASLNNYQLLCYWTTEVIVSCNSEIYQHFFLFFLKDLLLLKQNLKVLGLLWPAKELWELFSFHSSTGGGYKWHQQSSFSGCLFFTFFKVEFDYRTSFNLFYLCLILTIWKLLLHFMLLRFIPVSSENTGMTQSKHVSFG